MREHHIRVRRTARYYLLEGATPVREIWIACHGYRQLAGRFASQLEPLRATGTLVVVPEALNRFYVEDAPGRHGPESRVGATWMTRDDRLAEIEDYIAYLDALLRRVVDEYGQPARLVGLGFSQGVATIARWAVQSASAPAPHALIAWGAALPPDLGMSAAQERLAATRLLLVAGDADRSFPAGEVRAEQERLADAGVASEVVGYPGGHRIHAETLTTIAARLGEA